MSNSKWAALGVALLASTSLTTGAMAAEWTAKISGSGKVAVGYVDIDDDPGISEDSTIQVPVVDDTGEVVAEDVTITTVTGASNCPDCENIALVNDGEIDFDFKLVADNGITFGYHMELENEDNGSFDEWNAYVSGAFGTVELGFQDGAYDKLLLTPPGCSFACPGDNAGLLFDYYGHTGGQALSNVAIDGDGNETSDDLKLTYYTPKFSGFQAGVSFIPDGASSGSDGSGNAATDLTSQDASAWEFGARWQGDLTEDVDLGVSGGYALSDSRGGLADEDSWSVAAELGLFGGAIGGRYTQNNARSGANEESVLSLGAEYGTGPWGFFVNYAQTLDSDISANDGDWGISGEVDYDVAPGVVAALTVEYGQDGGDTDFDSEFAIGTWLGLSF